MEEKDFKALIETAGKDTVAKVNSLIDAAKDDNQKTVTAIKAELMTSLGADSEHIKAMQAQLDAIETENKKQKEGNRIVKSLDEHLAEMIHGDEFKSKMQKPGDRMLKEIPFDVKLAGTMLNSGQSGAVPYPTLVPGVSKTPDIPVFLAPLCNVSQTNSDTVYYIDRSAETRGAKVTSEGSALGQSDMTYTQRSASVFDIGGFIKISKNMINDNAFMASEISNELTPEVLRKLDYEILNGTGTTTFDGLINRGTAFSVTGLPFATSIPYATNIDVLRVAIALGRRANYQMNAILVHPDDYAMMEMSKDADGSYAIPSWFGGLSVSGVRIIPNTLITSGTFVVADMTKAKLVQRQQLMVEAFYEDSDNATKRLVTFTAYLRAAFYISAEHAAAFQNGTFSTCRTAITEV